MVKMNQLNPTAKLISNFIVLIICFMIFDPKTMLMLLTTTVVFGIATASFHRKNLKAIIPLACFAIAMLWMNAAWAKVDDAQIIGTFGPLRFTDKGLSVGLSLCFRVLTIGVSSILFVSNTKPDDLIFSLIKQMHLSPGIAYGILTAFRFLPSMESDLALINAAHRIRQAKNKKWYSKKNAWYRNAIPLLATNVRKAERVAIAMEARGFENNMQRTYYKTVTWKRADTIFIICTALTVVLIVFISVYHGWFDSFQTWQGF